MKVAKAETQQTNSAGDENVNQSRTYQTGFQEEKGGCFAGSTERHGSEVFPFE